MDELADRANLVGRTRDVVSAIATLTPRGEKRIAGASTVETLGQSLDVLVAGERHLRRWLGDLHGAESAETTRLLTLLVQVQSLRLAIAEERVRLRAVSAGELHRSLSRLRVGLSTAELFREVPRELGRLGFSRSLLSGLRGSTWAARTAFAHQDEDLAGALVRVGSALPGRIGREQPETEAVRAREAVLVLDAQTRPHVHRELVTLGDTRDYAVAPIVVHGRIIGLVHIDRHSQSDVVDSADRELLTLFADGAGLAFERAMYHERFTALRRQFELQISGIDEVVHGTSDWWEPGAQQDPVPHPYLSGGPLSELTRRELEVLQHIAGGASNQDIAGRLGVSAGTVKTHVKGLLHKLGAANRADAGAKYHAYAKRSARY